MRWEEGVGVGVGELDVGGVEAVGELEEEAVGGPEGVGGGGGEGGGVDGWRRRGARLARGVIVNSVEIQEYVYSISQ